MSAEAQGKRQFVELDMDIRIILKRISDKYNSSVVVSNGLN